MGKMRYLLDSTGATLPNDYELPDFIQLSLKNAPIVNIIGSHQHYQSDHAFIEIQQGAHAFLKIHLRPF